MAKKMRTVTRQEVHETVPITGTPGGTRIVILQDPLNPVLAGGTVLFDEDLPIGKRIKDGSIGIHATLEDG